jgi:hypothetical protein
MTLGRHLEDQEDDDIKMGFGIRWENMDWINLAQNTDEWQAGTRRGSFGFNNTMGIFLTN